MLASQVEVSHTDFTKVTRMVFVEIDTMVMHTTRITATTRMLAVFANTAMTMTYMTTKLSGLLPLDIWLFNVKWKIVVKRMMFTRGAT